MWHFRNHERPFCYQIFKPKSSFHPSNKDAVIETYLNSLEERFDIPSKRFNNPTKDRHQSLYQEFPFSGNFPFIKRT